MFIFNVNSITCWNLIHAFLQCSLLVVMWGRVQKAQRQQETRAMIFKPLIHLFRLEYPSWNREALCSAIRDLEEAFRRVRRWEVLEEREWGKKREENSSFPKSPCRDYQVLKHALWEKFYRLHIFVFCKQYLLSILTFFSTSGKERSFFAFLWAAF